nr:Chain C, Melanoma antigen variant [Homo sapiens]
ILNAMIVKI